MQPGVFINYRREDSAADAGRLRDRVAQRVPENRLFMDVDSIGPGAEFAGDIDAAIHASRVFLVVIGERWLTVTNDSGKRRIEDHKDLVRSEINAALTQGIAVVPVLVENARMPTADELPHDIKDLADRNAFRIRRDTFLEDCDRLIQRISPIIGYSRTERLAKSAISWGISFLATYFLAGVSLELFGLIVQINLRFVSLLTLVAVLILTPVVHVIRLGLSKALSKLWHIE